MLDLIIIVGIAYLFLTRQNAATVNVPSGNSSAASSNPPVTNIHGEPIFHQQAPGPAIQSPTANAPLPTPTGNVPLPVAPAPQATPYIAPAPPTYSAPSGGRMVSTF